MRALIVFLALFLCPIGSASELKFGVIETNGLGSVISQTAD
jgi:hypothetical protein